VRVEFARVLYSAARSASDTGDINRVDDYLGRFEEDGVLADHLDNPDVRVKFAQTLVNAVIVAVKGGEAGRIRDYLERFEGDGVLADHLDDPDVRLMYAKALVKSVIVAVKGGEAGRIRDYLERFEGDGVLADHLDDPDVRIEFAKALKNAIIYAEKASDIDRIGDYLERFEGDGVLADHLDDPDVHLQYAQTLTTVLDISVAMDHLVSYPYSQSLTSLKENNEHLLVSAKTSSLRSAWEEIASFLLKANELEGLKTISAIEALLPEEERERFCTKIVQISVELINEGRLSADTLRSINDCCL
jgi:hypothetical protein